VIFWVDLTLRIRSRRSFRLGIAVDSDSDQAKVLKRVEELAQLLLDRGRDLLLGADRLEQLGVGGAQFAQHRRFEPADIRHCDRVEVAAGAGKN